jgi:hypothetical protein
MSLAEIAPEPDYDLEEDPFTLTNLRPRCTGLPMTVYVGFGGGAKYDARVKVSVVHDDRIDLNDVAIVSIRPEPKLLHGQLSRSDLEQVRRWVELNRAALLDHWEERTDGMDLIEALKPL